MRRRFGVFQSTPLIAEGRPPLKDGTPNSSSTFQSTPLIAEGRHAFRRLLRDPWSIRFNPRPSLLRGDTPYSEYQYPERFVRHVSDFLSE